MAKAIITFDLPEDQMDFNRYSKSLSMAIALYDISNLWSKHNLPRSVAQYNKRIREILDENNINIDSLVE